MSRSIFTKEEIEIANKCYRATGAVGKRAVVPKYVAKIATKEDRILDFGAGTRAIHAIDLKILKLDVTPYDFGRNVLDGIHVRNAIHIKKYDIIYASNVLNVQCSKSMLGRTLGQIKKALKKTGTFVFNYPSVPRKAGLKASAVLEAVKKAGFKEINKVFLEDSKVTIYEARLICEFTLDKRENI